MVVSLSSDDIIHLEMLEDQVRKHDQQLHSIMERLQPLESIPMQLQAFNVEMTQVWDSIRANMRASFKEIFELLSQRYNLLVPDNEAITDPLTSRSEPLLIDKTHEIVPEFCHESDNEKTPFIAAAPKMTADSHNNGVQSELGKTILETSGTWDKVSLFLATNDCSIGGVPKVFEKMQPRVKMKQNHVVVKTMSFKRRGISKFRQNGCKVDSEADDNHWRRKRNRAEICKKQRQLGNASSMLGGVLCNYTSGEVPSNSNAKEDNLHCLLEFFNEGRHQFRFCANGVTSDALITNLLGDWICDLGPKLMRMLDVEKENLHTDMIASVGNNDLELVAYGNKERLQFHLKSVINTHDVKVDLFFLLPAANKRIKQIGVIGCGSKGSAQGSETLADEWKAVSGNDLVLLWDSEALKATNYEKVLFHILPNNLPGAMDIESVVDILETKNSGGSSKTKRMVTLSICYMWISWVFLGVKIFRWLGVPNFVEDSRPRIKLKANYALITDVTQIMEELAQVSGLNDVSYAALQQSNSLKNSSYQVEISSNVQGFLENSSKQQTNRTIYGLSAVFLEERNSCYFIKHIHSEQLGFRLDFRGLIADTINDEIALQVLQAKVVLNINLFTEKQLDSNGVAYKGSVDGFTAEFFEEDVASKHNGDFSGVPKSVSRVCDEVFKKFWKCHVMLLMEIRPFSLIRAVSVFLLILRILEDKDSVKGRKLSGPNGLVGPLLWIGPINNEFNSVAV